MADNPFAQFAAPPAQTSNPFAQFAQPPAEPAGPRSADEVQAEYDAMPWYQKAATAAYDTARLANNGLTMGAYDALIGAITGNTDQQRAMTQEARDRAGSAGLAAEVGGAGAVPIGAGRAGLTLAGRLGSDAVSGLKGLAARSGLMAAEGSGYGALSAAGNNQDVGQGALLGAIFGAGGNAAAEGLTNTLGAIAGMFGRPPVPTMADITAARDAAYKAADDAGVVFSPQGMQGLNQRLTSELADFGYDPALQPGAAPVLRRLGEQSGDNVTLKGLDTLRKMANHGYDSGGPMTPPNRSNNAAVNKIVGGIDDLIDNPQPGDVLVGDAAAGAQAMADARDMARRAIKASEIEDRLVYAGRRAASTGKGGNIDNATRQNMRHILDRGARGYTPDEVAALNKIVYGTPTQNFLRWAGGFAPQNNLVGGAGLGIGASIGGSLGGLPGALAGAAASGFLGQGAKILADNMTRGGVEDLLATIMRGGTAVQPNAVQRGLTASQDALARLFMQGGNVEANQ